MNGWQTLDQHARGVYQPGFTDAGGHAMFVAVDGQGRLVAMASVTDEERRSRVLDAFRDLLRVQDPDARLVVVD